MALDATAERLLHFFAGAANKSQLDPLDWGRFYVFIIYTHKSGFVATDINVRMRLGEEMFPEELAARLADFYSRALELLQVYDQNRARR